MLIQMSVAQAAKAPWLNYIDKNQQYKSLHTITTKADVKVSDGLTYQTETLFHDHQRAIFKRLYQDKTITQGVEGKYYWSFDSATETELPPFIAAVIVGHQFHAQMLAFDNIYQTDLKPQQGTFETKTSLFITGKAPGRSIEFHYNSSGKPLGFMLTPDGQPAMLFAFRAFKKVAGVILPHHIYIDDGKRQFDYHFSQIRFNQGDLASYRAPDNVINDEQRLLRLHRNVMDDHFFERTDNLAKVAGENITIVSSGSVYNMDKQANQKGLKRIMNSRKHYRYDDLIRPQVTLSKDGTLGWVIVQVQAQGIRLDENSKPTVPLNFISAWIELYQKHQGAWKMVGNVSNFQPKN